MPLSVSGLKTAVASGYRGVFGGRIARTTFALRAAIYCGVIYLLAWPLNTILATSSQATKDLYSALALAMLALCLLGFVSTYVKRLHDMGLGGYWAIVALIITPGFVMWGLSTYSSYRWNQDHSFNTASINDLALWIALAIPLLMAMWKGEPGENRFGALPPPVEHLARSNLSIAAIGGTAAILIPLCIYIGLFQHGVWVGRGESAPPMPFIGSAGEGTVFMKCWNVKGVGAGTGKGDVSGVYRDGYKGVFDFVQLPDGGIDIVPAGGNGVDKSYRADGFKIYAYGLNLPTDRSRLIGDKLDQFMIVAVFDQGGEGAGVNFTTFTFGRTDDIFPPYQLVMTTGISSSDDVSDGLAKFPHARGKLMVGDCMAG